MHATEVKISTYNKEYAPRCTITASDFRQMVIKNVGIQVDCCVGQSRSEMHVDELNLMQKSFVIKHIAWHFDNTNLDLSVIVNRLQLRSNDFEQHFSDYVWEPLELILDLLSCPYVRIRLSSVPVQGMTASWCP